MAIGSVGLTLVLRMAYADRVLPGVRAAGVSIGGTSVADARRRLSAALAQSDPIEVAARDRTLRISRRSAGVVVNVDATVLQALETRRRGALGGIWASLSGLVSSRDVPLQVATDEDRFARRVRSVARRLSRPSFAGRLRIDPRTLAVRTEPPRAGTQVDRTALSTSLKRALRGESRPTVPVVTRPAPVAAPSDVAAVGRAARDFLTKTLRLQGRLAPLDVSPDDLARVLALESLDGGRRVRLGAGDRRLAALVSRLAARRDRPGRDARLSAPATSVTVDQKGDLSWRPRRARVRVRPGRTGRRVRRRELAEQIEGAIRNGRHVAFLPVRRVSPAITDAAARRARFVIGTFTTRFAPGQPRVKNIRRIAAAVDGMVVPPGARFSLNQAAGSRTSAKGYVEAPFIADGKIVPSIGGGVSQFSTTLYNAVYFAGLQIDGHQPHSFYIDRYPPGREATLNLPGIDLTWTNDTGTPVLIRASSAPTSVTVTLYGDTRGRRVRSQAADRVTTAAGAFSVVVTRVVRYKDGRTVRQPFTTRYDRPPAPE